MAPASSPELDGLLEEIITDAHGDSEQLEALFAALKDALKLPCDAHVIGEPVEVVGLLYDGNLYRGIVAQCLAHGAEHTVSLLDVHVPPATPGADHVAAYRKWSGLPPWLEASRVSPGRTQRRHKADVDAIPVGAPIDLAVLAVRDSAARCRVLGSSRELTLRSPGTYRTVPGEIITVRPAKSWTYARHPYLSGEIVDQRADVGALGLTPLALTPMGDWDPEEEYWGEPGDPIEPCLQPIIAAGPRPSFEMEQVVPGDDPAEMSDGPILEAIDLKDAGDRPAANRKLMDLVARDLRCLDAHAHLGNFCFEHGPEDAIRHYEMGVRIGELSLAKDFNSPCHGVSLTTDPS